MSFWAFGVPGVAWSCLGTRRRRGSQGGPLVAEARSALARARGGGAAGAHGLLVFSGLCVLETQGPRGAPGARDCEETKSQQPVRVPCATSYALSGSRARVMKVEVPDPPLRRRFYRHVLNGPGQGKDANGQVAFSTVSTGCWDLVSCEFFTSVCPKVEPCLTSPDASHLAAALGAEAHGESHV